jgi:hypothetical protein
VRIRAIALIPILVADCSQLVGVCSLGGLSSLLSVGWCHVTGAVYLQGCQCSPQIHSVTSLCFEQSCSAALLETREGICHLIVHCLETREGICHLIVHCLWRSSCSALEEQGLARKKPGSETREGEHERGSEAQVPNLLLHCQAHRCSAQTSSSARIHRSEC